MAPKSRGPRKTSSPQARRKQRPAPRKAASRRPPPSAKAVSRTKRKALVVNKASAVNKAPAVSKAAAKRPNRAASDIVENALAAFAHEVRTPLTGILAVSDLLATSELGERERRWVETIKASAEHLASLATLFVDAARSRNAGRGAFAGRQDFFDLRVLAEVEGYGVSVDELGRASVYFRMKTSAWFESTGALVYQTWQNHEAPLMTYYGYYDPTDPADVAAERAVNLIELGQVSGAELRARVADMASEAGAKLARQMVDDSRM